MLHGAGAPLHICEANASLTKLGIYDIIISTNNHKTAGLSRVFRYNVCYHPKERRKTLFFALSERKKQIILDFFEKILDFYLR